MSKCKINAWIENLETEISVEDWKPGCAVILWKHISDLHANII